MSQMTAAVSAPNPPPPPSSGNTMMIEHPLDWAIATVVEPGEDGRGKVSPEEIDVSPFGNKAAAAAWVPRPPRSPLAHHTTPGTMFKATNIF